MRKKRRPIRLPGGWTVETDVEVLTGSCPDSSVFGVWGSVRWAGTLLLLGRRGVESVSVGVVFGVLFV